MKQDKSRDESNLKLDQAIGSWKVAAALPVDFKSTVWKRIGERRPSGVGDGLWVVVMERIFRLARLRSTMVGTICMACVLGLGLGVIEVKRSDARFHHSMESRYLSLVDPNYNGQP